MGQINDAARIAEYHDVLQQEADLTSGHGIMRYTGLISISAPDEETLQASVAAVEQAAVQASCETRPLVGQQTQASTVASRPLARVVSTSCGCGTDPRPWGYKGPPRMPNRDLPARFP